MKALISALSASADIMFLLGVAGTLVFITILIVSLVKTIIKRSKLAKHGRMT